MSQFALIESKTYIKALGQLNTELEVDPVDEVAILYICLMENETTKENETTLCFVPITTSGQSADDVNIAMPDFGYRVPSDKIAQAIQLGALDYMVDNDGYMELKPSDNALKLKTTSVTPFEIQSLGIPYKITQICSKPDVRYWFDFNNIGYEIENCELYEADGMFPYIGGMSCLSEDYLIEINPYSIFAGIKMPSPYIENK